MAAKRKAARRKSGRGSNYHHGDLRRALLDAALAIVESDGIDGLTLRSVARSAGVSHAAPKHHFGDLRGLHCALAEEGFHALRDQMVSSQTDEPDADSLSQVKSLCMAYVEFASRSPGHFRGMFHSKVADRSGQPELEQAAQSAFGLVVEAVQRAQDDGQIREGDTRGIALAAWALVHGLSTLAVDDYLGDRGFSSADPVVLADQLIDLLQQGMRA